MTKLRSFATLSIVASVFALALGAHAASMPSKVTGIRPGYHETKYGSEFYFEIPTTLASRLAPGDLLEPDDFSQRVMFFGGNTGFCIDPDVPAGDIHTAYRITGHTSERALSAARAAVTAASPRDEAIWAEMRVRPESRRMNYNPR
jgi:hypothetical protein